MWKKNLLLYIGNKVLNFSNGISGQALFEEFFLSRQMLVTSEHRVFTTEVEFDLCFLGLSR